MTSTITVFGATGVQGGSVVNSILTDAVLSNTFSVRGITRDTSKPAAQALSKRGVEVVSADMSSKESLVNALKGSRVVFIVTNYWETADPQVELAQGYAAVDAAREVGVEQIIFSSLLNVTEISGGRLKHVPHFDGKAAIEEYVRSTGITCAFVLPGYYMSNYQQMLQKHDDGSYALAYPIADAKIPLFAAAEDMGKFVKPALKNPELFNGKQILAATDYYQIPRIVAEFEEVTGKKLTYHQVSPEQYKAFLPESIAEEYFENHLLLEEPGYFNGIPLEPSLKALEEKPTSWKEFLQGSAFTS